MIHRAAPPEHRTQSCSICGTILLDFSKADLLIGSGGFHFFPTGAAIERGPKHVVITICPPDCCSPAPSPEDTTNAEP